MLGLHDNAAGVRPSKTRLWWPRIAAAVLAASIFLTNTITPFRDAFAVLYVLVVLLVADACGLTAILATGSICVVLACVSFIIKHFGEPLDGAFARLAVSFIAISVATLLSARNRQARDALAEQVRMLALTHDTVIVRDLDDTIIHWNSGAALLYGWRAEEALGLKALALLGSEHIPPQAARKLAETGQWSGEITRTRRDGQLIVLDVRWIVRLDGDGRECGIIEFGADLTEQRQAAAERERSEQRYSAIFQAVGFAIFEADCSMVSILNREPPHDGLGGLKDSPYIRDANDAAAILLRIADPQELVGKPLRSLFRDPEIFAAVLMHVARGRDAYEAETVFARRNDQPVDVFLRVTRPANDLDNRRVLIMALDITERNDAQMKLRTAQAALAHADRITTLGQLAVSIAHEVNQPLSAITTFARSGRRWLDRPESDIMEALSCFDQIAANSTRAAEIITRVRALTRKEPASRAPLALAALINETILLLQGEIASWQVRVTMSLAADLPMIAGDRIQIQQIVMNLMMNAIQAMSTVTDRARVLDIALTQESGPGMAIHITFQDSGPGFAYMDKAELFEPFVTTKTQGMGMGLSICKGIAETHGGWIEARNRVPYGAIVTVTLPCLERPQ